MTPSTATQVEANETVLPALVHEELEVLARVSSVLSQLRPGDSSREVEDYGAQLISLRDQLAEARTEDAPPLLEEMGRLQQLLNRQLAPSRAQLPVDPHSPYFGRLVLREGNKEREVLLSRGTHIDLKRGVRIVDWRHAPVARLYFACAEGDDYEEEFGDRLAQGEVLTKRSVTIRGAELRRVASDERICARQGTGWRESLRRGAALGGGQGSALRPADYAAPKTLGVGADSVSEDRRLAEVTGMLTPEQYRLISSGESQVLTIQGGAGSGKTTVGLHRLAYLAFQQPERFPGSRMLVLVASRALRGYVAEVLPALGVPGVQVQVFDRWAFKLACDLAPGLNLSPSGSAYADVEAFKYSAQVLRALNAQLQKERAALEASLVAAGQEAAPLLQSWRQAERLPLRHACERLLALLRGRSEALSASHKQRIEQELLQLITRSREPFAIFTQVLSDSTALEAAAGASEAEAAPSAATLARVAQSARGLWARLEAAKKVGKGDLEEDDAVALSTADTVLLGWLGLRLGSYGKSQQVYAHIFADEAQDLSPVELALVLAATDSRRSVTFAGDMAQRQRHLDRDVDWEASLAAAGATTAKVAGLRVTHRSTRQVAALATHVLGEHDRYGDREASREGAAVELFVHDELGEALAELGAALRNLMAQEPQATVAVICRHPEQAARTFAALERSEVPKLRHVTDEDFVFRAGVDVVDVAQVRGLEFDYAVVTDVDAQSYRDERDARFLLHVAVTRAIHQLWLVCAGEASPLLAEAPLLRYEL